MIFLVGIFIKNDSNILSIRNYYKVFMPSYEQDEEALEHFNKFKRKISQNRLLLISAVNMLTFALSIFSISYYKWVWIEIINLSGTQDDSTSNQLWVNLLYGKSMSSGEYKNFDQLKGQFCRSSDATCQALFIEFRFVGIKTFNFRIVVILHVFCCLHTSIKRFLPDFTVLKGGEK